MLIVVFPLHLVLWRCFSLVVLRICAGVLTEADVAEFNGWFGLPSS